MNPNLLIVNYHEGISILLQREHPLKILSLSFSSGLPFRLAASETHRWTPGPGDFIFGCGYRFNSAHN